MLDMEDIMSEDLIDQYKEKLMPMPKPGVCDWLYLDEAEMNNNVIDTIQWDIRRSFDEFMGRPSNRERIKDLMRHRIEIIMRHYRDTGDVRDYSIYKGKSVMEIRLVLSGQSYWDVIRVDMGGSEWI
jgi:hypothetical protein